MMRYRHISCAAVILLSAAVSSPSYATDFFLTVGPGTSSTDFGNTGSAAGSINDRFFFTVPAGSANGLIGSIALSERLDVDFTTVLLDDTPFDTILSDGVELRTLAPTFIGAGLHAIYVNGTWGPDGGSYAGTLNFSPVAVAEPATWALMIGGVGLVGGALRRRRTKVRTTVSFA